MKKILAFLSAAAFLGSSTLAVSACGVGKGQEVEVEIKDAPTEAENNQDPLVDYVYNNQYIYNSATVTYPLSVAAQLISDKLYTNPGSYTGVVWDEFYSSQEWQRGYFSSVNYDANENGTVPSGEHAFSYQGASNKDFIIGVNNNDFSEDKNIIRFYWYITSPTLWSSSNPTSYQPTKNNIVIPEFSEFNDDVKTITKTGYVHLYLLIGNFRLDFNAELNFNFFKITDKNNQPAVLLNASSYTEPFGKIDFNNPSASFDKVIKNLDIVKVS